MEGFNNYTGHMSYISTWEERQRKMEQNKADVKRDRFDLFNDLGIESKEVIDGIGDCSKCFYKYNCHKKQNGYYCRHYLDCSEHDKKVWNSAIEEFGNWMAEEGFESSCHNIKCWIKEYKILKENNK